MKEFGEEQSHVRDVNPREPTAPSALPPLLAQEAVGHSRYVMITMLAAAVIAALGLLGYESLFAPNESPHWTPPKGLTAADTPDWLQTLCADQTRELCTAADQARTAQDCDTMRAALKAVAAIEKRLAARGVLNTRQHWVLVELYGQGQDLCQFEREK